MLRTLRRLGQDSRISKASHRVRTVGDSVWNEFTPLALKYDAVNLSQGIPSLPVAPFILEQLTRAARPGVHHQYTRPAGHPALVTHLARFYAPRLDRAMDPFENVLITSGATQGLFLFFQTFIDPGDEVIIMEPFYDSYPGQIEMAYGVPVSVPLRPPPLVHGVRRTSADWKLDFDELRRAFSPKTKALVLNTPHNPSGHVFTREELQKIADLVTEHDAVVLSDEVYEHITYDRNHIRFATIPGMWERTVTLGSSGKAINTTGWKVGWAFGPEQLLRPMQDTQQFIPFCVTTPMQEALAGVWARLEEENFFERQLEDLLRRRDFTMDMLTKAGLNPTLPEGAYFVMGDTSGIDFPVEEQHPPFRRDFDFCRWLTKEVRVAAIPPSAFYSEKNAHLASNYARFCFAKNDNELQLASERLLHMSRMTTVPGKFAAKACGTVAASATPSQPAELAPAKHGH